MRQGFAIERHKQNHDHGLTMKSGIVFLFLFLLQGAGSAEPNVPQAALNLPGGNLTSSASFLTGYEFWLAIAVMIFGGLVLGAEYLLLRGVVENKTQEIVRTLMVTLIVIATLILIVSGFSNNQIAPALGLFGTIAGYLLGKAEGSSAPRKTSRRRRGRE